MIAFLNLEFIKTGCLLRILFLFIGACLLMVSFSSILKAHRESPGSSKESITEKGTACKSARKSSTLKFLNSGIQYQLEIV